MCEKCAELQKQLDIRNENTKVWIQADTQTRAYACKLEREVDSFRRSYSFDFNKKASENKSSSGWITCYRCHRLLHEVPSIGTFKLSAWLLCIDCCKS